MADVTTVLPPNATALERNIEQSATATIEQLPVPVRDLWNPDLCPVALLPWLAWALDVTQWKSDWPESVKREAIKQSIKIHDVLGTIGAVQRSVALLWADSSIVEWFDYAGSPYHFRADLSVVKEGFNFALIADVTAAISETKNVRSVMDNIRVVLPVGGNYLVAATTITRSDITVYPGSYP